MTVIATQVPTGPLRGRMSMVAYELPEGLSYEEWAEEGPVLGTMARASMFWLGDWVRYGEDHYGERYAQAIEMTGLSLQTIQNVVWVCSKIGPGDRRENVPFWHHQEVAALDDRSSQLEILDRAEAEGLTQREVRREARRRQRRDEGLPEPEYCSVPLHDLEAAAATLARHLEPCDCQHLGNLLIEGATEKV